MTRSPTAPPRSDLPLTFGCVRDPLWRRRLESSLRGYAEVRWFETFVDLREALETEPRRVLVAVVELHDRTGASAQGFARTMGAVYPGIGIVAYRESKASSEADICQLGAAGVHDVLVAGITDEGYLARSIVLDSCRRGAAELVMQELSGAMPPRLAVLAEVVIRDPSKASVGAIAQHLNIHRQTPNNWCKKERYLRPEEMVVWCRLFLVAAMLELTSRTLESIALELDYASATSLRNQLRIYTGMTSTAIRTAGLAAVIEVFQGRVAQRRAGFGGIIEQPADRDVIPLRIPSAG